MLGAEEIAIKDNTILIGERNYIPLDDTQRAILNWYGKGKTYAHIPRWEVVDSLNNNDLDYLKKFKDKIVYVGTTATSLSDVKSVPTESNLAGVELHATFINNILDKKSKKSGCMTATAFYFVLLHLVWVEY